MQSFHSSFHTGKIIMMKQKGGEGVPSQYNKCHKPKPHFDLKVDSKNKLKYISNKTAH
jgi:hypothetical protein